MGDAGQGRREPPQDRRAALRARAAQLAGLRPEPRADAGPDRGGAHALPRRQLARRAAAGRPRRPETAAPVTNPADAADHPGTVAAASAADVATALAAARPWQAPPSERAAALNRAADLYEEHFGEIFAILAREAGKSLPDSVAELREAVDFLRYYAANIPAGDPAGSSPASAPGTSRWPSSPARSPPPWRPATPCSPSPPSRRR
ncbi:aldehyde dehydrogenase family protein [Seohaeicola zhoushanensis]